jgi:hypothetical protein
MLGVAVLWPLMVGVTGVSTFFLVQNACTINAALHTSFVTPILLTCVTYISALLVRLTVQWEDWHPRLITNVGGMRHATLLVERVRFRFPMHDFHTPHHSEQWYTVGPILAWRIGRLVPIW